MRSAFVVRKIALTWLCPECGEDHTTEHPDVEVEETSCGCCSTDVYVEALCPRGEKFRVELL